MFGEFEGYSVVSRGDSKTRRIYETLRDRILSRELPAGSKLPSHLDLAAEFGVAPMTVRTVLGQLEGEGLVSREQGRGTFVRPPGVPTVLVVDDDLEARALLRTHVTKAGYRCLEVGTSEAAMEILEQERSVELVLSEVQLPDKSGGIAFIQAVRRRWRDLPLAVITAHPNDLSELYGTSECPILVLAKPLGTHQLDGLLRLVLERRISQNRRDSLTGLPSREVFDDRLKHSLSYANRHDQHVALLLLNLDDFTRVNERFGHETGDILLREVGRRLVSYLRDSDTVAHIGSDEFAVILPNIESRENASIVARKIAGDFNQGFSVDDRAIHITASAGISLYPFDGTDAGSLVRAAERSVERAKRRKPIWRPEANAG
jgi:diguanylate cyclase (GGDEF)-like protein